MTLSMVYLRLTLLSAFAIIVLVCISYAHSSPNEREAVVMLKERSAYAHDCTTSLERTVTGNNEMKHSALETSCN